ncbi:MAG: DUF2993 domain-containing protein [Lyngbya sp.]|nr:DUF2993 domain-containing protein [Lyngbya sp.]
MHIRSIASTQTISQELVSKVLSGAVKMWLRSQVEQVDVLDIDISGSNRSLLTGHISQVTVGASSAVYQGLHLSQVYLSASGIHINIGQILKGKPLQLLKPFPIHCQVCLLTHDFNTSLQSPLLTNAIVEFLVSLIQSQNTQNPLLSFPSDINRWKNLQIAFSAPHQLTLTAEILSTSGELIPFAFHTELYLDSPQDLLFTSSCLQFPQQQQHWDFDRITINLGTDVYIQQLNITPEQLQIKGEIRVNP